MNKIKEKTTWFSTEGPTKEDEEKVKNLLVLEINKNDTDILHYNK